MPPSLVPVDSGNQGEDGKAQRELESLELTSGRGQIIHRQVRRLDCPAVFTQPDGTPCSADQVGVAVVRAAKRAGLDGVSLHTLRHTFISRLAQAGWPLPEVAALAGHRDIKMTLRYAHLAPSHLRAGIQALEQQRSGGDWVAPGLSTENCVTLVSREMS